MILELPSLTSGCRGMIYIGLKKFPKAMEVLHNQAKAGADIETESVLHETKPGSSKCSTL
jgi:hypothetical protein